MNESRTSTTTIRRVLGVLLVLGLLGSTTPIALAQTPQLDGQWSEPFALPLIAIHSAMLPTGKVLLFSAEHGVPGIHGWLLDPTSLELTNVPPPAGWNPDCSGHSFLADGRLLVAGGTLQFNPLLGSQQAFLFDPWAEQWIETGQMARGRWYPTNLTLPDGRIMTLSGLDEVDGSLNPDLEIWDPEGDGSWEIVGAKTVPFYPYLQLLNNGLVFRSGPDSASETLSLGTFQWTAVGPTVFPTRFEAPSVLLPPTSDRVMLVGGIAESGAPTNSAEIIDFSSGSPQWTPTSHMASPRMEHAAVILPDGRVLVLGGQANATGPEVPVLIPETFDPLTESWDQLAPHQIPRMYHSSAVLLPDGRVFLAGADFQPSAEIFSPPYLFRGSRPTIVSSPSRIAYGTAFDIEFTTSTPNNTIVLIRLSSSTHSLNMGQRYVRLAEIGSGGGTTSVPAPATSNLAPPGYYMLFVVDDDGVPSESSVVQLGAPAAAVPAVGPAGLSVLLLLILMAALQSFHRFRREGDSRPATVP